MKSKDDLFLRLAAGSIFRLLKSKNISSILEKMRSKGFFLRGTDDWIYKVLYYRCLKAICRIPWGFHNVSTISFIRMGRELTKSL